MEDSTIVEMFLARNENAIKATKDKYGSKILNIAQAIVGDSFTAEECENDTYISVWNLIPPNEPKTYFIQFLTKIVRNIALDRCRQRNSVKRAVTVSLSDELAQCLPSTEDVAATVDARLLGESINKFLKDQPKEIRIMFIRRYWYEDSISEIAEKLDINENKVKVSLHRTRKKLKKHLEKEGYTV